MSEIHSTAIINDGAKLGDNVTVGAYAYIGANVTLGDGCAVHHHATVDGNTTMGANNQVFPYAFIGGVPQDLKYKGEDTKVTIGDNNIMREYVTIHMGTATGTGETKLGNNNLLMGSVHIAHDCLVGNYCVFANVAGLAGHVKVEDFAILGGMSGVHQFCAIGKGAMLAGNTMVIRDIPPFVIASNDRAKLYGINHIGMRRRGAPEETINAVRRAYKLVFRSKLLTAEAIKRCREELGNVEEVEYFVNWIEKSKRGVTRA